MQSFEALAFLRFEALLELLRGLYTRVDQWYHRLHCMLLFFPLSLNKTEFTVGKGAGKGYSLSFMSSQRYLELENIVLIDPDHFKSVKEDIFPDSIVLLFLIYIFVPLNIAASPCFFLFFHLFFPNS
jgi:hypothetical protein